MLLALARLNDVSGGRVLVDGADVGRLPLATLRKALVMIPQEPHLFAGTLRFTLAPWGAHADAKLTVRESVSTPVEE